MFKLLLSTLLFVNVSIVALQASETSQRHRMLGDLDFIKKTFEYGYAPAEWKKELFAWDLEGNFQSAVEEINNNNKNDIKQFQKLLKKFCKSTRDYHVSIMFTSTEYASLPFDIRYRGGKYIITSVDEEEKVPFKAGYEILTIDGIPVETAIAELQKELGEENRSATDRALALEILTRRNGRLGHPVPQGSVTLEVKKPHSNNVETCQISWNYKPERISNPFINNLIETIDLTQVINNKQDLHFLENEMNKKSTILPYYEEMTEVFADDGLPRDQLGSRKSIFSALGKEREKLEAQVTEEQIAWIWKWFWRQSIPRNAKKYFDAQLIELPSGKYVGYARISTFNEENPQEALAAFRSCINYFQNEADMLLIDQTNNPGGSPVYMYALASMLTDRPLKTFKDRRLLTQENISKSIDLIDTFEDMDLNRIKNQTIGGLPANDFIQGLLTEARFLINEWEIGHLFTDPYHFLGIETVKPHSRINFTKPIFVLINEMDFSCADEFPAILQDNKRATIIGTPTAGAGGEVSSISFTNLNGINQLRYTTSITQRLDGSYLENKGVTPDIFFDFNNELYDQDKISPDFTKIFDILDSLTPDLDKKGNWGWLD